MGFLFLQRLILALLLFVVSGQMLLCTTACKPGTTQLVLAEDAPDDAPDAEAGADAEDVYADAQIDCYPWPLPTYVYPAATEHVPAAAPGKSLYKALPPTPPPDVA